MKPTTMWKMSWTIIVLSALLTIGTWLLVMNASCVPSASSVVRKTAQAQAQAQAKLSPPTILDQASNLLGSQHDQRIIERTIHTTDYLLTMFIVVMVLGVIAGLHGLKSGWIVAVGCVAGAGMKAAFSITSVYLMSGLIFLGVILAVIVVMTVRTVKMETVKANSLKKAFKDVVGTVQRFKDNTTGIIQGLTGTVAPANQIVGKVLRDLKETLGTQKPETQQLVTTVKKELVQEKINLDASLILLPELDPTQL